MSNTPVPQKGHLLFYYQSNRRKTSFPTGNVGQDKSVPLFNRSASPEPYRGDKGGQSKKLNWKAEQSGGEQTERTAHARVPFTTQLKRFVKEKIHRIAKENKISDSAADAALLERMLQQHADMQYGALLEPVIQRILHKEMHTFVALFEWLLVRVAFDTSNTRSIVTNMWSRWPGVSREAKEDILRETAKAAKENIFGKSPQLTEL